MRIFPPSPTPPCVLLQSTLPDFALSFLLTLSRICSPLLLAMDPSDPLELDDRDLDAYLAMVGPMLKDGLPPPKSQFHLTFLFPTSVEPLQPIQYQEKMFCLTSCFLGSPVA